MRLISLQERPLLWAKTFNLAYTTSLLDTAPWETKKKAEFEFLPFSPAIKLSQPFYEGSCAVE
jgi:hypothetical protein